MGRLEMCVFVCVVFVFGVLRIVFFRRILSLATVSCCMHVFCYIFSFASYVHAFLLVWQSGHHYLLYASVFLFIFVAVHMGLLGGLASWCQQILSTTTPNK